MLATLTTPEGLDSQIVVSQQVFRTMTGMEVSPLTGIPFDPDRSIGSLLHYRGACAGTLILECSVPVAFAFASRLMSIPTPTSLDDDVKDTLRELINMIGGNLKGLLPAETAISTPTVFVSGTAENDLTENTQLSCIEFSCEFGWFRIRLHEDNSYLKH